MKDKVFNRITEQTKYSMHSIWLESDKHALNEQAIPSYLNSNKFVSDVFWKRVRIIIEQIEADEPDVVLDFGCGIGTLFLFFQELKIKKIIAYDAERHAILGAKKLAAFNNLDNIDFIDNVEDFKSLPVNSIDTITALDVLEHIADIDVVLDDFHRILKVKGSLYISGPTENWFYRLSRKFGGEHYKNHFHISNIYDIEKKVQKRFYFKLLKKIWPIITFFRLSKSTKQ